jgi:small subunit ribosomal protein S7
MSRRNRPEPRVPAPDSRYNSVMVARFINSVMLGGKKSTAERIVYGAMDVLGERAKKSPLEVFEAAIREAMPVIEVKPRRVGGATYQVPVEVRPERRLALAMRWLVDIAKKRPGKTMAEKLAGELYEASQGQGATIKKKEDTHKMADANKAFAHYRW